MIRQALAFSALFSLLALAGTASAQDTVPPTNDPAAKGPQTDRPAEAAKKKEDRDAVRVGPLLGLGFPRPLTVGGLVKVDRILAFGAEYGFMPTVSFSGVEASFKGVAGDLRVFPFRNSFFVGLRGGRQWINGKGTLTVAGVPFEESADAATWFVNPRIGFLKTFDSGFTIGIDAGVQLPISPSYVRSGTATSLGLAQNTDVDRTLKDVINIMGNGVTPTVDLLKVGFLF